MEQLIRQLLQRSADPRRAADSVLNPVPPPVSVGELRRVEQLLGFDLPDPLKSLYLHVGNGGFGPGYGLFNVPLVEPGGADLVGMYWYVCGDKRQFDPDKYLDITTLATTPALAHPEDSPEEVEADNEPDEEPGFDWQWPRYLLPILSHGCGIYECVDWRRPEAPVILHQPDFLRPGGTVADTLAELAPSLERRLQTWLAGEDLHERANAELTERAQGTEA